MVMTPWGDSALLRERKLSPGSRLPADAVARNQRERLFAAMVATVAEKGYEATRVEDLVKLSGVSRSAFYLQFADKQACFLAAVQSMVEVAIETILSAGAEASGLVRAREVFEVFVGLIVDHPAGARMCFVEIYAAGPDAVEAVERAAGRFEGVVQQTLEQMPDRAGMPAEIVRGMIGGLRALFHTRLYRHQEGELPELTPQVLQWILAYLPPPARLRPPRRRPLPAASAVPRDPVERILRAVEAVAAEKSYPETTVADIVAKASTSQSTFYANFANREEALLAALDRGSAQMLAAVMPAFRRAPDWPRGVRAAIESLLAFAAAEPEFIQLGAVEVYSGGRRALELRDEVNRSLVGLLAPGHELKPDLSPIASEAIGGAIYALIYDQVRSKGPASLPQLTPVATYIALAPFLGAEEAGAIANGKAAPDEGGTVQQRRGR
jgi:AcrR family transcriptional regulator